MQIIATITGDGLRTKKALTKMLKTILIYIHVWTLQMGQGSHMCGYMCITYVSFTVYILLSYTYICMYIIAVNAMKRI